MQHHVCNMLTVLGMVKVNGYPISDATCRIRIVLYSEHRVAIWDTALHTLARFVYYGRVLHRHRVKQKYLST